jgi:hypothetical protein
MERAFQANVERGFNDIVDSTLRTGGRGTLLSWMNSLDRHLERLLTTTERGPTLKFVPNVGSKEVQERRVPEQVRVLHTDTPATEQKPVPKPTASVTNVSRVYTAEEKAQAERRRAVETKQIEARLGRLPLFQKSRDELSYVIPVQPSKVERLPVSLRPIKTVKLLVPRLYPLEPSSIELQGVRSPEAQSVEVGFSQWVKTNAQLNLMSQINYLTSNMHTLATTGLKSAVEPTQEPTTSSVDLREESAPSGSNNLMLEVEDKPHIRVIPRPPEWSAGDSDEGTEVSEFSTSEDGFTDEDGDDEDGGAPVPDMPAPTAERGVALSFPYLELYGIELLELVGLYITIKCDRCKEHLDVRNVPQVKDKSDVLAPKVETCKKCTNTMSLGKHISLQSLKKNPLTCALARLSKTADACTLHPRGIFGLGRLYRCRPSSQVRATRCLRTPGNASHIHVVALSRPAQNARRHFLDLASLQFAARVLLLPAVSAIAKWVSSDIVKS